MPDATMPPALRDRPFAAPVGELVGDALVLWKLILLARPELVGDAGVLHVTFDGRAGSLLVCLQQPDGRLRLVERFGADPRQPETFGCALGIEATSPMPTSRMRAH